MLGEVGGVGGGLSDFWTQGRYGEGTWCAVEVLGHLVVAERDDWMPRVRRVLRDGDSKAFDPFPHTATVVPGAVEMGALLAEFRGLRESGLRELKGMGLAESDLARTGMHPALGRVTLGQLLATWAAHDLHHVRQMCLAMAWQFRDEVGPWRAYLNTLAPR